MKPELRYRSPVDLTQPEFQAELRRVIENSLCDFPQGADGVITLGGVDVPHLLSAQSVKCSHSARKLLRRFPRYLALTQPRPRPLRSSS
jgi:hypothetical protein